MGVLLYLIIEQVQLETKNTELEDSRTVCKEKEQQLISLKEDLQDTKVMSV